MGESRRHVLKCCGLAVVAALAYATRASGTAAAPTNARLIAASRQLYPYDELDDVVYEKVIDSIVSNPTHSDSLSAFADALGGFVAMDDAERTQAMMALESTPLFWEVRNAVQHELHDRPELWQLIGYEGPSLPFGGYANEKPASLEWLDRS